MFLKWKTGHEPVMLCVILDFMRIMMRAVSLSVWGTEPELKEKLMLSVMSEEITGSQSLTR